MATTVSTLNRHILEQQQKLPEFSGQLSQVLVQIAVVGKALSREIGRAALAGRVGLAGEKNPTGDSQKKLDMFTNETIIKAFAETGLVSAIASEELDEPHCLACESDVEDVEYVLCTDPLDGSSNTDTAGASTDLAAKPSSNSFGLARNRWLPATCFTEAARCWFTRLDTASMASRSTAISENSSSPMRISAVPNVDRRMPQTCCDTGLGLERAKVCRLSSGGRFHNRPLLLAAVLRGLGGGFAPLLAGRRVLLLSG